MISSWFKRKERFGFCYQLLLKLSRVRWKRNKKISFRHNFSHFQIFETFENLEIDVSIILSILCLNNDKFFRSCVTFFVKTLTHHKTDFKHWVTMPSNQEYCMTCICSCIKFYFPRLRQSWVICIQKIPISCDKYISLSGVPLLSRFVSPSLTTSMVNVIIGRNIYEWKLQRLCVFDDSHWLLEIFKSWIQGGEHIGRLSNNTMTLIRKNDVPR